MDFQPLSVSGPSAKNLGCHRAGTLFAMYDTEQTFLRPVPYKDAMRPATVQIPVYCPVCGEESLERVPVTVVAKALHSWRQMRLYARCHDVAWNADRFELQAIQQFLGPIGRAR